MGRLSWSALQLLLRWLHMLRDDALIHLDGGCLKQNLTVARVARFLRFDEKRSLLVAKRSCARDQDLSFSQAVYEKWVKRAPFSYSLRSHFFLPWRMLATDHCLVKRDKVDCDFSSVVDDRHEDLYSVSRSWKMHWCLSDGAHAIDKIF